MTQWIRTVWNGLPVYQNEGEDNEQDAIRGDLVRCLPGEYTPAHEVFGHPIFLFLVADIPVM